MANTMVPVNSSTLKESATVEVASAGKERPVNPFMGRDFRLLWTGSLVSSIGDQFYLVALPWLVLQITGSSVALGTILMIAAGPRAVLMLVGGVASDQLSPRRILLTTAWIRSLLVLTMGVLLYFNLGQLWQLYALAAAFGSADAFSYPAGQALLPSLVDKEQLPAANSLMMSGVQLSLIVGPLAAGQLVKRWGMTWAFIVDALSFVVLIAALLRLQERARLSRTMKQRGGMRGSIMEGLRYAADKPTVRSLIQIAAAVNFCLAGPVLVGLATLANKRFASALAFGTMISALSIGALVGALAPVLIKRGPRRGVTLLVISALLGVGMLLLGLLHGLGAITMTLVIMGMGSGWINVTVQAWLQTAVDREFLGRVVSLLMFAMVGLAPLSYFVAGLVVQASLSLMFGGAGVLVLAIVAVAAKERSLLSIE